MCYAAFASYDSVNATFEGGTRRASERAGNKYWDGEATWKGWERILFEHEVPIRRKRARMFYLDHVESDGRLLFEEVVKMDLEGIVCKRKDSPYKVTEKPSRYWIKVKNPRYSQLEGREELFERN